MLSFVGTPENKRDRTKSPVECSKSQPNRDNDKLKSIFTERKFEKTSVLHVQMAVLTRIAGSGTGLQSPGTLSVGADETDARLRPRGASQYRRHGQHLSTAIFSGPDPRLKPYPVGNYKIHYSHPEIYFSSKAWVT